MWHTERHKCMCIPKVWVCQSGYLYSEFNESLKVIFHEKNKWYCSLAKTLFSNLPALLFINLHCNISLLEECLESEIWRVVECRIVYCLPEKASARVICLLCSDLYSGQHAAVTWQHENMTTWHIPCLWCTHYQRNMDQGWRLRIRMVETTTTNYKVKLTIF